MLRTSILLFTLLCNAFAAQAESNPDSLLLRSIYDEALTNGESYENLRTLTKDIGHRLSGSQSAADAMQWGSAVMRGYGADSVWIMPVMVPSWTRGSIARSTAYIGQKQVPLRVTALGGSVGTPNDQSIRGKVIMVKDVNALDTLRASAIAGRIVLFNRAMDPVLINTGAAYGGAVDQRGNGASAAAKAGAIGALVRSMTHALDTLPLTPTWKFPFK